MGKSGIQLVSDGTSEGSHILVDGCTVRGEPELTWLFNDKRKSLTIRLTLDNISISKKQISDSAQALLTRLVKELPD